MIYFRQGTGTYGSTRGRPPASAKPQGNPTRRKKKKKKKPTY